MVVIGESRRAYKPEMRSVEFEPQRTHERFRVEVKPEDRHFVITLSPGEYRLNLVQISEGPFMSMAELYAAFTVPADDVIYVGTWRFGVESPRHGRMVALSIVMESDERSEVMHFSRNSIPVGRIFP